MGADAGQFIVANKRSSHFRPYSHQFSGFSIYHRPVRQRGDDCPAIAVMEFGTSHITGPTWRPANPCDGTNLIAFTHVTTIIDLVPKDYSDKTIAILWSRSHEPVRHRGFLNPNHPHRIVHMAELIDIKILGLKADMEAMALIDLPDERN